MINFNLKKKKARQNLFYKNDNILSKIGFDLIDNKIKYINKNLSEVLILDYYNKKFSKKKIINLDQSNLDEIKILKFYDGIISNFGLQIPFSLDLDKNLNLIFEKMNINSLFCFNLLTINTMKTIKNIFLEIDEYVYKGSYSRFGPFFDVPEIIGYLNKFKFKDVVVSTEYLEFNYHSLGKLRSDFKEFGMINLNDNKPKFKKEFLIKTESVFSKIIEKFDHIPVEFEIATFTSWK